MGLDITGLGAVFDFGSKIIDKVFPDKNVAEQAKLKLIEMTQNGELQLVEKQISTIVAEAQSEDKWTSRARPSFMYVIYLMLLASIPFGFCYVYNPTAAATFVTGYKAWFDAIPENLYWLFGTGYLGYTGARVFDKNAKSKMK